MNVTITQKIWAGHVDLVRKIKHAYGVFVRKPLENVHLEERERNARTLPF